MSRPTRAVIDLAALRGNALKIRAQAQHRRLMAAIKADAYGHGSVNCAKTLEPLVDGFAVAFLEEALTLRQAQIRCPILVLEGPMEQAEWTEFLRHDLWPVVHRPDQLHAIRQHQQAPSAIWLNVDTGMHRLGLDIEDLHDIIPLASSLCDGKVTLMSHMATADDMDHPMTTRQLARWRTLLDRHPLESSLLNSASTLLMAQDDSQWLRPGYLFYGCHPSELGKSLALAPVMRFESAVIAVRDIAAGEQVGYGGRWRASRNSRIATIPVGYADGYPRSAKDGTPVWISGQTVPLAGTVSMDMLTVDVTDHPGVEIGSPVSLWGESPTVDTVAVHAGTIGYELTSRVTARVPRQTVNDRDVDALETEESA